MTKLSLALKRRTFIFSSAAFAAGLRLRERRLVTRARGAEPPEFEAAARALARLFSTPAHAWSVGDSYLRRYPERTDPRLLLAGLRLDAVAPGAHDVAALRSHIRGLQRRDFADGNTVMVDGWILSRTEASVCGLLALS